jgi:hypothetical protein
MVRLVKISIFRNITPHSLLDISEATCCSEIPIDFQRTTRRILEDKIPHNHLCANIRSYLNV